jgi:hypothetical protein
MQSYDDSTVGPLLSPGNCPNLSFAVGLASTCAWVQHENGGKERGWIRIGPTARPTQNSPEPVDTKSVPPFDFGYEGKEIGMRD